MMMMMMMIECTVSLAKQAAQRVRGRRWDGMGGEGRGVTVAEEEDDVSVCL